MADLGPLEEYSLASRKRRVDDTYGLGTARNAYERSTYEGEHQFDVADLRRQLTRARTALPYGYAGRGLLNSGIYQEGLQNFLSDQDSIQSRMLRQHLDRLGGFTIGQQELDRIYQSAQADIEEERAARRAAAAASILGY